MKKNITLVLLFGIGALFSSGTLRAQDITVLYTGETHAMLYTCNCPIETDGGVARRATMVKQLRRDDPELLLLDSGAFFAAGLMDEYTLNTDLDIKRTEVNLKALALMKYDGLTIGDEEFNFGTEFLQEEIKKTGLNFLSCDIVPKEKTLSSKPYIIKEVKGLKVGIIGVSPMAARQKAEGLVDFIEPKSAVKKAVAELKKEGVNITILLSHQGEAEDLRLIKEVKGIDVVIIGQNRMKEEPFSLSDGVLILKPFWQGRRLGKLTLKIQDKKIKDFKVEELRLSDKVSDDTDILKILPVCFSDSGCKEKGMQGSCVEPGTMKSVCVYSKAAKVGLTVIRPKDCITCNTDRIVKQLQILFPGLAESYVYYPGAKAEGMIKDFGIKSLPAFLLGKEAENEKGFDGLKDNVELRKDFYLIRPAYSGLSFLLGRERIKDKLDVFISLYDKDMAKLLEALRPFQPTIHFLAAVQKEEDFGRAFSAKHGNMEGEEYLRAACVQKYYPEKFYDYITCRAREPNTSWWEDCLTEPQANKVRGCSRSDEGKDLLKENISLNTELQVMFGPTYLVDNQEIFSTEGLPAKDDFKKLFHRN